MTITRRSSTSVSAWVGGGAVLVAASLLLGGCTGGATKPSAVSTSSATTETPTPTPTPTVVPVYPLTGLPNTSGAGTNPSIASKIDDLDLARPQIGLQYTDVVFEELVEGGLTRYIAVWQSKIPTTYGPVRSIRGMDPAIVSPLGGIITYSGGQLIFVNGIRKTDVKNVSDDQYGGDKSLFHRISTKSAPHNLVASGQNILAKFGAKLPAPQPIFTFAADAASSSAGAGGTPASKITAKFSTSSVRAWTWDPTTNLYGRSQNGKIDKDDKGNQLTAVNVVTVGVTLKTISHTPVSQLIGGGKATVSTGGKTIQATWKKGDLKDPIHLFDPAGNPITLAPGNTWVELVATGGSVTAK